MRSPKRLDEIYYQMKELHKEECPDMRMFQLIMSFMSWTELRYGDPFYIEDREFLSMFKKYMEEMHG